MRKGRSTFALADGRCTSAVAANTFIGVDYNTAGAGDPAIGIAEKAYNIGELVDAEANRTAILKLGTGGCAAGDWLTPDASGFGVVAGPGDAISAFALEAGSSGDLVEVRPCLIPPANADLTGSESVILAHGEATLVGGTVDVAIAGVTTSSKFLISRHTAGGSIEDLTYVVTAGHLVINSGDGSNSDTSVVTYAQVA